MRRPPPRLEWTDFPILVALSLVFFGLVIVAVLHERDTDWLPIQRRFVDVLAANGQAQAAREFQTGVKQIWIPELGRVDRCVTCHLACEWGTALPADLPEPLKPHPALAYMEAHPFAQYGCTVCHGGQGFATDTRSAHGEVEHWDEPLLSSRLAARYDLTAGELMQSRCDACHRRETSTPGMELVNRGKELYRKRKCVVCHAVEGKGGLTAPDLTLIGDKDPELFDFSHVKGAHTVFDWQVQHLTNAEAITPGTTMPTFDFPPEDARALALLLLSWRQQTFPPRYLPGPVEAPATAPLKVVREVPVPPVVKDADAGRQVFIGRGCNSCHAVGGGVLIGPDLQGVGTRRDADWLRRWLADPAAMIRAYPELAKWPSEYGNIVMPNQNLSSAEINVLVGYLARL
jgi:cytochrome c2